MAVLTSVSGKIIFNILRLRIIRYPPLKLLLQGFRSEVVLTDGSLN